MTDVAESCAPFPLQLHHAHLQLHLLPLSLTDTDSTTVLDAHVFSPLHEFGASCPLPEIARASRVKISDSFEKFYLFKVKNSLLFYLNKKKKSMNVNFILIYLSAVADILCSKSRKIICRCKRSMDRSMES